MKILDIAGGGGRLSAELTKLGQNCTIVDPRTEVSDEIPRINDLFSSVDHQTQIEESDLLLGLHCDGAVNEICTAACMYQKDFAIIACCVFPRQFKRKLNDGQEVVLREDLNKWMIEECERNGFKGELKTEQMEGFDGANICVYGKQPK